MSSGLNPDKSRQTSQSAGQPDKQDICSGTYTVRLQAKLASGESTGTT